MFELCINEKRIAPTDVGAETTLLEFLRQGLHLSGTKEGCASGDCGACTVVIGRLSRGTSAGQAPTLEYGTANSCITPLASLHGTQVLTVDALATPSGLHPAQAAMVEHHGSQCGYCTPGFVMTLVGASLANPAPGAASTTDDAELAPIVAGNLCRCTGYRSILAATREVLANAPAPVPALADAATHLTAIHALPRPETPVPRFHAPTDESTLAQLLRAPGPPARLLSGGTDLWLEVTQQYRRFERVIDISGIAELQAIHVGHKEADGEEIVIGSGVTLARLLALFGAEGALPCPAIAGMLERFASPQIRGRATLGGNIGNGSPIADWPPVLLALDAEVEIGHADGTRTGVPLHAFWLGYRKTVLVPGDYLRTIRFRRPVDWSALHVHKITKRHEDDISSVLVALRLERDPQGAISTARLACGGVAATPIRLEAVETLLTGWDPDGGVDTTLIASIDAALARTLAPISDVRASATYRSAMVRAVLLRTLDSLAGHDEEDLVRVVAS